MHTTPSRPSRPSRAARFWIVLFLLGLVFAVFVDNRRARANTQKQTLQVNSVADLSPTMLRVYDKARAATLRIELQLAGSGFWSLPIIRTTGIGTGFFISADGLALTAYHVIDAQGFDDDEIEIEAVSPDGTRYRMEVIGFDAYADLAVLQAVRLHGKRINYLPLSVIEPRIGDAALAIGNSNGDFLAPRTGKITNLDVDAQRADFASGTIEMDARLAQGDSGGPVLNDHAEVIGVVSYISFIPEDVLEDNRQRVPPFLRDFLERSLLDNVYASYAVPVGEANSVVTAILAGGQRDVPVVGVRGDSYHPRRNAAVRSSLGSRSGALVVAVEEGGPAERAGLRDCQVFRREQLTRFPCDLELAEQGYRLEADVITAVNEQTVTDFNSMISTIRSYQIGDTVVLTVWRNGKKEKIALTLDAKADVF